MTTAAPEWSVRAGFCARRDCTKRSVWEVVVTSQTERQESLCGRHYDEVAAVLRLFNVPFVSRLA
jgi:hypothetical protein